MRSNKRKKNFQTDSSVSSNHDSHAINPYNKELDSKYTNFGLDFIDSSTYPPRLNNNNKSSLGSHDSSNLLQVSLQKIDTFGCSLIDSINKAIELINPMFTNPR